MQDFWNLVEMGIIAMSLGAIVIYFYRMFETKKLTKRFKESNGLDYICLLYTSPSPRDMYKSRMPSSA